MFIPESLRTTHQTPHSATPHPSNPRFDITISSGPRYHKRCLVVISPTTFQYTLATCLTNRSWQHYTGPTVSDPPQQQTHDLWCPLARLSVNCYTDRKPRQGLNLQAGSACVYEGQCVWCGCAGTGVTFCQVMCGGRNGDWGLECVSWYNGERWNM